MAASAFVIRSLSQHELSHFLKEHAEDKEVSPIEEKIAVLTTSPYILQQDLVSIYPGGRAISTSEAYNLSQSRRLEHLSSDLQFIIHRH